MLFYSPEQGIISAQPSCEPFLRIHGKSKTPALLDINMYSNLYEGESISQSMNKKKIK